MACRSRTGGVCAFVLLINALILTTNVHAVDESPPLNLLRAGFVSADREVFGESMACFPVWWSRRSDHDRPSANLKTSRMNIPKTAITVNGDETKAWRGGCEAGRFGPGNWGRINIKKP